MMGQPLKKTVKYFWLTLLIIGILTVNGMAHEWMAPKEAAEVKNPVAMEMESISRGKAVYLDNCAACHGDNIDGLSAQSVGLKTSPPNLKKRIKTHSDGDFFWKIQEGRREMPAFKDTLSEDESWEVLNYIRSEGNNP